MKYEKPELTNVGSAESLVLHMAKKQEVPESGIRLQTDPEYQNDE
jgi:hypothetical protein